MKIEFTEKTIIELVMEQICKMKNDERCIIEKFANNGIKVSIQKV